jgi:hypothetical protein
LKSTKAKARADKKETKLLKTLVASLQKQEAAYKKKIKNTETKLKKAKSNLRK